MSNGRIWPLIALGAVAVLAAMVLPGLFRLATPFDLIGFGIGVLGLMLMNMLWWALIIGLGVWLGIKLLRRPPSHTAAGQSSDALDILKRRYASGEITREQYEQMRRDLER